MNSSRSFRCNCKLLKLRSRNEYFRDNDYIISALFTFLLLNSWETQSRLTTMECKKLCNTIISERHAVKSIKFEKYRDHFNRWTLCVPYPRNIKFRYRHKKDKISGSTRVPGRNLSKLCARSFRGEEAGAIFFFFFFNVKQLREHEKNWLKVRSPVLKCKNRGDRVGDPEKPGPFKLSGIFFARTLVPENCNFVFKADGSKALFERIELKNCKESQ